MRGLFTFKVTEAVAVQPFSSVAVTVYVVVSVAVDVTSAKTWVFNVALGDHK